jgi:hypothetical protein
MHIDQDITKNICNVRFLKIATCELYLVTLMWAVDFKITSHAVLKVRNCGFGLLCEEAI